MDANAFFRGGLTFKPRGLYDCDNVIWKCRARILRRLGKKAHVPVPQAGSHLITASVRGLRRLAGVGVVEGAPLSKRIQRSLVAAGIPVDEAKSLVWESQW